ncbi:Sh3 domain-binding glutamic acid-rich protein [Fasciolopsis buskii]|uniref:Sh3 domain-binding glutamic acid-rich protein n=1 Tax=Fasciolopsis buskii TaxID=27845 RepID=A0A8E0RKM5_9TREM|nr:Sh3 domain-binding glutamic acid-rich protein [Fasciolopsis buski]
MIPIKTDLCCDLCKIETIQLFFDFTVWFFDIFRSWSLHFSHLFHSGLFEMVVKVYFSSLSGSSKVKKQQSELLTLLAARKIDFESIDLSDAINEDARNAVFEEVKKKEKSLLPPHIFCDDEYLGGYDEFYDAIEMEELETFLRLPGEKPVRNVLLHR